MAAAVGRVYVDGVQPDVVAVEDAQTDGDDTVVLCDGGSHSVLWNGCVHGRDDATVDHAGRSFEGKQSVKPVPGNFAVEVDSNGKIGRNELGKVHRFCLGGMGDSVSHRGELLVERRINQWGNLENARGSPVAVDVFTEADFFIQGDGGSPNLFHAVCTVCIKIGKAKKPAVIDLNLMGGPGI